MERPHPDAADAAAGADAAGVADAAPGAAAAGPDAAAAMPPPAAAAAAAPRSAPVAAAAAGAAAAAAAPRAAANVAPAAAAAGAAAAGGVPAPAAAAVAIAAAAAAAASAAAATAAAAIGPGGESLPTVAPFSAALDALVAEWHGRVAVACLTAPQPPAGAASIAASATAAAADARAALRTYLHIHAVARTLLAQCGRINVAARPPPPRLHLTAVLPPSSSSSSSGSGGGGGAPRPSAAEVLSAQCTVVLGVAAAEVLLAWEVLLALRQRRVDLGSSEVARAAAVAIPRAMDLNVFVWGLQAVAAGGGMTAQVGATPHLATVWAPFLQEALVAAEAPGAVAAAPTMSLPLLGGRPPGRIALPRITYPPDLRAGFDALSMYLQPTAAPRHGEQAAPPMPTATLASPLRPMIPAGHSGTMLFPLAPAMVTALQVLHLLPAPAPPPLVVQPAPPPPVVQPAPPPPVVQPAPPPQPPPQPMVEAPQAHVAAPAPAVVPPPNNPAAAGGAAGPAVVPPPPPTQAPAASLATLPGAPDEEPPSPSPPPSPPPVPAATVSGQKRPRPEPAPQHPPPVLPRGLRWREAVPDSADLSDDDVNVDGGGGGGGSAMAAANVPSTSTSVAPPAPVGTGLGPIAPLPKRPVDHPALFASMRSHFLSLSQADLAAELRRNGAKAGGKVAEQVERATDAAINGVLPRCPRCHGGYLVVEWRPVSAPPCIYSCPGGGFDSRGRIECHFSADARDVARAPWSWKHA